MMNSVSNKKALYPWIQGFFMFILSSLLLITSFPDLGREEAKQFAPGQLQAHFLKHGHEFGFTDEQEYLDHARSFLNHPPTEDILEKVRDNGDVLRYKTSTQEFAVMTRTGRIRTYFKTSYQYWNKQ